MSCCCCSRSAGPASPTAATAPRGCLLDSTSCAMHAVASAIAAAQATNSSTCQCDAGRAHANGDSDEPARARGHGPACCVPPRDSAAVVGCVRLEVLLLLCAVRLLGVPLPAAAAAAELLPARKPVSTSWSSCECIHLTPWRPLACRMLGTPPVSRLAQPTPGRRSQSFGLKSHPAGFRGRG